MSTTSRPARSTRRIPLPALVRPAHAALTLDEGRITETLEGSSSVSITADVLSLPSAAKDVHVTITADVEGGEDPAVTARIDFPLTDRCAEQLECRLAELPALIEALAKVQARLERMGVLAAACGPERAA